MAKASVHADGVINRLALELGVETDTALAKILGVSKTTISTWRRRNSIPYEYVIYYHLIGLADIVYVLTSSGRLSHYSPKSESLKNPEIEKKIISLCLHQISPVSSDINYIKRAANEFLKARSFYEGASIDYIKHMRKVFGDRPNKKPSSMLMSLLDNLLEHAALDSDGPTDEEEGGAAGSQ